MTLPLLLLAAGLAAPRDLSRLDPPYPRIGNVYGAGLGWKTWEQGKEYWPKLGLIVGGGVDLHYDWENPRWPKTIAQVEQNLAQARAVNPNLLYLPYVDVIEGPDNPNVPKAWWELNAKGERWSGWPGYYRINTKLPEVLQFNLDRTREQILNHDAFDGVFYDCWGTDEWLVPHTAALRGGQAVVMVNPWNLPSTGIDRCNGSLAEDELNRVVDGTVDFEDFLARYFRWCRESRKPVTTMLVAHPRTIPEDPWGNQKRTREERAKLMEAARTADLQTMRFGLATTLLGEGYFGYDGGNGLSRGNWWWYPEYDAPLGHAKGAAVRNADGTWQRAFDGGLVVANGTRYDAVITPGGRFKDVSTGRVAAKFTVPMFDGRILLPTTEPLSGGEDVAPRLTATPPATVKAAKLDDGVVVQTPAGLDVRFAATGVPQALLWRGQPLCGGGFPGVFAHPMEAFKRTAAGEPQTEATAERARLVFRGTLTEGEQRVDYVQTATVEPKRLTLKFEATAATPLDLRMWRCYWTFPTTAYAGAKATAGAKAIVLPEQLGEAALLEGVTSLTIAGRRGTVTVTSDLPLGLIDHRKYGSPEYLLAGYPWSGKLPAGASRSVTLSVAVE